MRVRRTFTHGVDARPYLVDLDLPPLVSEARADVRGLNVVSDLEAAGARVVGIERPVADDQQGPPGSDGVEERADRLIAGRVLQGRIQNGHEVVGRGRPWRRRDVRVDPIDVHTRPACAGGGALERHLRHVDAGHLPAGPGEPDGIRSLAAPDVECTSRGALSELGDQHTVRLSAPQPVAPARIPLVPVDPAHGRTVARISPSRRAGGRDNARMRTSSVTALLLLTALSLGACGGDDESPDSRRAAPERTRPEATIARWVEKGDCGLMTDRYVGAGYRSVAEGRRACQIEADKTPVEPYRVESTRRDGDDARVVLALEDGRRLTFWLIARGERGWAIDGYEERRPGDGEVGATEVMAAFERRTGERLDRLGEVSPPTYQALGLREVSEVAQRGKEASRRTVALVERFGAFNFFVAQDTAEAKRLIREGTPDEHGIHWRRHRGSSLWRAEKRRANVVLSWTAGRPRRTDGRFDLLDEILRRARRTAG